MAVFGENLELFPDYQGYVSPEVEEASKILADAEGAESRGAIFTRAEVVDFILDLVGYTDDKPLYQFRILEPSFGGGEFLRAITRRLVRAWRRDRGGGSALKDLRHAVQAVELHRGTYEATRTSLVEELRSSGLSESIASALCGDWLIQGDFLLCPMEEEFNFVVGNPPYVRQERIPNILLEAYRRKFRTMYDRSDLYIPFIERSLSLLADKGALGFICADRWTKNRYGGPLRNLVSERFHLKMYIDMVDTLAFHSNVIAYPAITVICREKPGPTRIAHRPAIEKPSLVNLAESLTSVSAGQSDESVRELAGVVNGNEPWLLEAPGQMELIRRLERDFPTIEQAGSKVGIGVATGADKAFIHDFETLDVEPDRKLPLATTRDILSGEVQWRGLGVLNPFADSGGLVDLDNYPRLREYLEARREVIAKRHCARKTPANWYRTIDRITPSLASKPKLLIPDIKGEAHVVYEDGRLYPHHNLYFITSETWDLRALQAVLLSSVARLIVSTYSTKMRGGFLRFQAQYLRRIHVPAWESVPEGLRSKLVSAAESRDSSACDRATFQLFNLSARERAMLGGNGE